jgi:hypothetical protein
MLRSTILLLVLGCSGASELRLAREPAPSFHLGQAAETPLYRDALWDDGNAEVARYRATEPRYGVMREGEAILIVVKETFDSDLLVKADGVHHESTIDVMKLNTVTSFQTGVYTYRQMVSAYLTRDALRPVKLAVGSQEWCGLTSKILTIRGSEALLRTFSYFGDEADRAFSLELGHDAVLYDALPMWLRSLDLDDRSTRTIRVLDEQRSNRATEPALVRAQVGVGEPVAVEVPAGSFSAHPVTVTRGEARDVFFLGEEAPHPLVRWERSDGGVYELTVLARAPYWNMHDPENLGDLLPQRPELETPPEASEGVVDG